jgi:hypothetical protein
MSVETGQRWRDLDPRSFYDVTSDGEYPIPEDYVGPLSHRPRIVEVEGVHGARALVRNVHNGRRSRVSLGSFVTDENQRRGFVRA